MYLSTLKKQINDFNDGLVTTYDDYVPLLVVEEYLKDKICAFNKELERYKEHLNRITGYDIKLEIYGSIMSIKFDAGLLSYPNSICCNIGKSYKDFKECFRLADGDKTDKVVKILENDKRTKEFINETLTFRKFIDSLHLGIKSNLGLFVNFNLLDLKTLKVLISDRNYDTLYAMDFDDRELPDIFYKDNSSVFYGALYRQNRGTEEDELNFYYYKDSNNERKIHFENEEVKGLINEELLGKIYTSMLIDISSFDKVLQEEIRQAYVSKRLLLKEKQEEEMKTLKNMQIDRIMKAYKLIKEAVELLNNSQTDIVFDRIKIDNLMSVLFKNSGKPNSRGFIEFEDLFKNNMILRMLDLSGLSLDNVDIRGMDFSYCNVHIDPQIIYNKDMSYVNATMIKFSPFSDSFDDVILDGAIITDKEANIDLSRVKSYNSETFIGKDTIKTII